MNNSRYLSFVRAAELHSLTKAAKELNYTQSNVSHIIQSLEQEYGFQLLVRGKGGVFLTENGEQLIDIMRGIFFPLFQDEMLAVVSHEKALEIADSYDVRRFLTDPFIQPHKSHADDVAYIFKQEKIKPNIRFEVKGDEAILALIGKNLGVGMLPKLYLESSNAPAKTFPLYPPQYRTIGLALSTKYDRLPIVDIFLEWLKT